jgi:8-oxo-dGTP pyrophosphatase MutT (NUDIX family)
VPKPAAGINAFLIFCAMLFVYTPISFPVASSCFAWWWYTKYVRAHAVAVFNGKILLLLTDSWNLIGGKIAGSESPLQALLREFEDETTISPTDYSFLAELPEAETSLYLVNLSEEEARNISLSNQGSELRFFSLSQLQELPFYHRLRNEFPAYLPLITQYLR